MIYVKDNVLSDNDIEKLNFLYSHPYAPFDETLIIKVSPDHKVVQKIKNAIIYDFSSEIKKFNKVDWSEIVIYPTGSSKNFHFDTASKETTGTSVTFLNDDIIGGEAVVEGVKITPVKGRTYFIDGKMYKHAVLNVIKGNRITLTSWYKKD